MDVLVLDTTSKSLRAVLGEAITTNQVDFTVHYGDVTSTGLTEGSNVAVSNGVTNVEILPVPAASTRRVIKNITVHNSDTVTHNVSLMLRNTATDYLLTKLYLLAGESWDFTEDGIPYIAPLKATAADINLGTDDAKYATAKSLKDSTNVPSVSPSTAGNVVTSNGTNWISSPPTNSFWTTMLGTPVRASNTSFTITGDYTALIAKGMFIKWKESTVTKFGMVSIPSTYGAPNTTVTIIGNTMASIDASSLKYFSIGAEILAYRFAVAGTLGAVTTDVANARYAEQPMIVLGADIQHGTAGVTTTFVADINKNGTTMFTAKPSLATTVASSPTPFTADNSTTLALGDKVTVDIDTVNTGTLAIDLYVTLYVLPSRYEFLV